ncbi:MAG TPA: type I methionyl aminopeptidase [Candidatus Omnitrophota bacterium]|nr:type I methionyl aminopeptidase [Candidatus Omnitrophota bacterium]HPS20251.1 type I methionyl aminopeptidase [Candidatus Omnitrophota bacterium]
MTILTSETDIKKIRESGKVLREIFGWLKGYIKPGLSTAEIDSEIEKQMDKMGGYPAFKGYRGYPAASCISVNEVVVHGIPSEDIVLQDGDIVSIDIGVKKNEFFTDAARTYPVGKIPKDVAKLIRVTEESLYAGIKMAVEGNNLYDISNAIERKVADGGFQEVRMFVGHGIGRNLHEPPEVPNWGEKGKGPKLKKGLLLAIEPMVNMGTRDVEVLSDGWTAVTRDRQLSAHFEHTVIVGEKEAEALT